MEYLRVRNWERYQHYKAQRPAWIKLYTQLHDDADYITLTDVQKAHMIGLLLLAARTGNKIPNDDLLVGRMMHMTEPVDLNMWITRGLLVSDCGPKSCINTSPNAHTPAPSREVEKERDKKDLDLGGAVSLEQFFRAREPDPALRNPRSLSIPKDPYVLAETVYAWLLHYWPEEKIGAGMPVAIRTWQGTIPGFMEQAAALKRELETSDYGKPGDPVRWRELSWSDQRGKIALSLNSLKKVAESRG